MSEDAQTPPAAARPAEAGHGFGPLRHAEQQLLAACRLGGIAKIGFVRPDAPSAGNSVRAAFLAHLARGGADPRRAPRRIQLLGAWIDGVLDLAGCAIASSLWFYRCTFAAAPVFDQSRLAGSLAFPGCALPGLQAEGCRIAGDLLLNAGCTSSAGIELSRAVVRGRFDASRSRLGVDLPPPGVAVALNAPGLRVGGDLLIGDGLAATGALRLTGAQVGGDVCAGHARLDGPAENGGGRGVALDLARARIAGDLRLDAGFSVAGRVRLRQVRVGGDLDATGAAFDRLGDAAWGDVPCVELDRARIAGTLRLQNLAAPLRTVSLADARVAVLADDAHTWGERIVLDGFAYARFDAPAPTDAASRIAWLKCQPAAHLADDFRRAPWRRLARVLRRAGHDAAASEVAIAAESLRARSGRVGRGLPQPWAALSRAGHGAWGLAAGYGHRPGRLVGLIAAVWLACAALFWIADGAGAIAPRAAPAGSFAPLVYSLDHLLPGIDLHQRRDWRPVAGSNCLDGAPRDCWGAVAQWTARTEALLGWAGALALLVLLVGNTRRDP